MKVAPATPGPARQTGRAARFGVPDRGSRNTMRSLDSLIDQVYGGQERLTRDEIYRRAVVAEMPAETLSALDALPEGEYAYDEVAAALIDAGGLPADPDEAERRQDGG